MKVMIVVTHLLGTGHLARALTLARAFEGRGHPTTVISGGMPVPHLATGGVHLQQLPPLRSDGVNFSRLLDKTGQPASDELYEERASQLTSILRQTRPDVLITELFPFGRRNLKAEFQVLLQTAQSPANPPLVCASIRDILAPPGKPAKARFAEDMIAAHYDAVLVHSDPDVTPLDNSWPVTVGLRPKLHYTGFVAPEPPEPHPQKLGQGEVLVSAGGGDVGDALFAAASQAAALDGRRPWRLLIGATQAAERIAALQANAPANLTVERVRPDYRQMLHHAAASVSFCGYNTALDLLQTGCPAVLVPFDDGSEVEQSIRAKALQAQPGFAALPLSELSATRLLSAVNGLCQSGRCRAPYVSANGAAETVTIVEGLARRSHGD